MNDSNKQNKAATVEFLIEIIEELMIKRQGATTLQEIRTLREASEIAQKAMFKLTEHHHMDNAS